MKKDFVIIGLFIYAVLITFLWLTSVDFTRQDLEEWIVETVVVGVDGSGHDWGLGAMREMGIEPVRYKLIKRWRRR